MSASDYTAKINARADAMLRRNRVNFRIIERKKLSSLICARDQDVGRGAIRALSVSQQCSIKRPEDGICSARCGMMSVPQSRAPAHAEPLV
jgi:hypothetical protein